MKIVAALLIGIGLGLLYPRPVKSTSFILKEYQGEEIIRIWNINKNTVGRMGDSPIGHYEFSEAKNG